MARPKKARVPDRIVQAIRDRLLQQGWLDAVRSPGGRLTATRVFTKVYGPGYEPPPGTVRLKIHAGRGRPPRGCIGLVQAIAAASGYSVRVVARALTNAPRAGTRRGPSPGCPMCGHDPELGPPDPIDRHLSSSRAAASLAAVGLVSALSKPRAVIDPLQATRSALVEALDAAVAMGAVGAEARALAERLRNLLEVD